MLMTAAVHMDSTSPPPPPWFSVPAGNHRLPYDFTASSPTPATATATATATAATPKPNHHQQHLRPARRVAKRRPRPSRKQPTTYITADPASFRRMVHQVTGADDLPVPPPPAAPLETLCRPAPYRTSGAMMLPTLDTSAFLIGAPGAAAPTDAPCAGSAGSAPAPAVLDRRPEASGACNYISNSNSGSSCGGGGFPTLDSWDALL